MKIAEVSQFFDYKGMSWKELIETKEKGVVPSIDRKSYLWTETPIIKEVKPEDSPYIGHIWLTEAEDGSIRLFKVNYDTSD